MSSRRAHTPPLFAAPPASSPHTPSSTPPPPSSPIFPDPPPIPPSPSPARRRRRRPHPFPIDLTTSPPPKKRRTAISHTAAGTPVIAVDVEEEEEPAEEVRRREEEERVRREQSLADKDRKKRLLARTGCTICLEERMTDMASTPCGHLFCHQCLVGAVRASASAHSNKMTGKCPVCRGKVAIKDIILLENKKTGKRGPGGAGAGTKTTA